MTSAAHLTSPVELKFQPGGARFEGYASVFGVIDGAGDRIAAGAFATSLQRIRGSGVMPPLLWQHDAKEPIGAWREIREDAHGLYVCGELFSDDIARAREAQRLLREGVVTGLSIGYRVVKAHRDTAEGCRVLTEIDLLEISMVTFPANTAARVARVKSDFAAGHVPDVKTFEAFLREAGMSRKQAKGLIAHGYRSLLPREAAGVTENHLRLLARIIRQST